MELYPGQHSAGIPGGGGGVGEGVGEGVGAFMQHVQMYTHMYGTCMHTCAYTRMQVHTGVSPSCLYHGHVCRVEDIACQHGVECFKELRKGTNTLQQECPLQGLLDSGGEREGGEGRGGDGMGGDGRRGEGRGEESGGMGREEESVRREE